MKITMALYTYVCLCGKEVKEYVWDNEIKTKRLKCECKKQLSYKNLKPVADVNFPAIRTPTKNR